MAERTVNVVINYKVNTAEVQKAQAASQAAQRATDQLRNSATRYGTESAKAFKQSGDAARATQREVASLDSQFNNLYNTVKILITAGLAKELVSVTLEMAKLSGTVEGVEKAFSRLPNATLLLESLRKATRGTVTDLELMQKALMASNFRIPLEKLGTLLEFAAVKAQQTGQEVNHLVNYIVSGIGYRSIKRLDDLGFTANRVKEALGGVSLQAATMGQVMDAVTKLMQEDLDKTGGYAETAATKVGQITTKWHELRVLLAQKFENSSLLRFFELAIDGAKDLVESIPTKQLRELFSLDWKKIHPTFIFGQAMDVLEAWRQNLGAVAEKHAMLKSAAEEAGRIEERLAKKTAEERIPLIQKEIDQKSKVADAYMHEALALEMAGEKYSDQAIALRANQKEIEETIRILKEYKKAQEDAVNAPPEPGEDPERKGLPRPLTQVVDLRFKDPKTGQITKESNDKIINDFLDQAKKLFDYAAQINPVQLPITPYIPMTEWEKAWERNKEEVINLGLRMTEDQVTSILQLEAEGYTARIEQLRSYYDEQVELAGDNERKKKELRIKEERDIKELEKRRADRDKKAAQGGILVHTALSIMKVFSGEGTYIDKLIRAAIVAAEGASQYAVASRAKYYAKGGINIPGPGTETSDSIPAFLSRGESVITAKATRRSMGLLEAIQANKIDDRVLKSIDFSGGRAVHATLNDERIVGELKSIRKSQYRLEEQAGILYRVHEDDRGNKKRIRSKSI